MSLRIILLNYVYLDINISLSKLLLTQFYDIFNQSLINIFLQLNNVYVLLRRNIYIIGMMNTADRSLAIMDYALRRRFSFFEFVPAFNEKEADMATFWTYVKGKNNPKFEKLIKEVQKLNDTIAEDESLGKGFRIGHSYFITEEPVTDELLTNIVENELVPLLEEYWFDAPEKANDYSNILRESIK